MVPRHLWPPLVASIALLWSACAPAPAVPPVPSAAVEAQPVRGGTFRIAIQSDLPSFDSGAEAGAFNLSVDGLVQSGLMKWDKSATLDQAKVTCDLCESWKQVNDTTYEFKLRQGVRWHNVAPVNGRELVADDVKYTFERIQNLGFKNIQGFGRHLEKVRAIKRIETPDRYTVRLELDQPQAIAMINFGDPWLLMVAREEVETEPEGLLRTHLIGTGPFILKEFTKKVSYSLDRNPDYFQKELPYLDGVEVRFIPDPTTTFNAFRAGEIHDPGAFMDEEKKRIVDQQHPGLFVGRVPGHTTVGFVFNNTHKPFDDVRVRKAIYLAFDRQGLIDATRFGYAQLARWVATPGKGIYATPEEELLKMPGFRQPKEQDVAEARRLLADAGLAQGFKTTMAVVKFGNVEGNAEVLAEQMRKALGLEIVLQPMEQAVHTKETQAGNFDFSAQFGLGSQPDPSEAMWLLHSRNPANVSAYKNPAFDELVDKQGRILDPEERKKVFFQMYEILDRDVPVLPAYADFNYKGYPRRCHGITEEPRYNTLIRYMSEAWCEPGVLK